MAADSPQTNLTELLVSLLAQELSNRISSTEARILTIERTLMTRTADSRPNEGTGTPTGTTSTAPMFGRTVEHIKRLWAATSTLSVWGKVLMWLAPRAVIMWGIAQGWLQAAWRLLREWLRVLF